MTNVVKDNNEMKTQITIIIFAAICPLLLLASPALPSAVQVPGSCDAALYSGIAHPSLAFSKRKTWKRLIKMAWKENPEKSKSGEGIALGGMLLGIGAILTFLAGSLLFIPVGIAGFILSIIGLKRCWHKKGPGRIYATLGILLFIFTAAAVGALIALFNY
ncbi:MAG: hypothetical protein JNM22_11570 [Saprospiraceae bacterium]|nr:hypothetical protein [Saprospiraceae bacterium]